MNLTKQSLLTLTVAMAFGFVVTTTSCNKKAAEETTEEVVEEVEETMDAAAESVTDAANAAGDAAAASAYQAGTVGAKLTDWWTNGQGTLVLNLDGISWDGEDLSAEGKSQLEAIAQIMEANPTLKGEIQGHTDQKSNAVAKKAAVAASKTRAMWTKAKLILGHDAVGSRLTTKGYGDERLLPNVAPDAPEQKRIAIEFSK